MSKRTTQVHTENGRIRISFRVAHDFENHQLDLTEAGALAGDLINAVLRESLEPVLDQLRAVDWSGINTILETIEEDGIVGYARYEYDGKLCGYAVPDVCNEPGCDTPIDRGLAFACGGSPGEHDDHCDGYFCAEHLHFVDPEISDSRQLCGSCLAALEEMVG